jgi:hypothetical protein
MRVCVLKAAAATTTTEQTLKKNTVNVDFYGAFNL